YAATNLQVLAAFTVPLFSDLAAGNKKFNYTFRREILPAWNRSVLDIKRAKLNGDHASYRHHRGALCKSIQDEGTALIHQVNRDPTFQGFDEAAKTNIGFYQEVVATFAGRAQQLPREEFQQS